MPIIKNEIGAEIRQRLNDISDLKTISQNAEEVSQIAKQDSYQALSKSDVTQKQLDEAIKSGNQPAETQQARVNGVTGESYDLLYKRLDTDFLDNLSRNEENAGKIGILDKLGNIARSIADKLFDRGLNVYDFGAVADGNSHPLSERYSTLSDAQSVYPFADSLDMEIDYCAIQKTINTLLETIKVRNKFTYACKVVFPSGDYVVGDNTINSKPYIKLTTSGFSVITANTTGTVLRISCDSNEPAFYKEMWNRGNIISGMEVGFVIRNLNKSAPGSRAIDIGNDETTDVDVSRYTISQVGITGFETALYLRNTNHYLGSFNHLHLEGNTWAIATEGTQSTRNSGENFRFRDCVFAITDAVFRHQTDAFDVTFTKCSFDFIQDVLQLYKGYSTIRFDTCYFEKVDQSLINSLATSQSIQGRGNVVIFENCVAYIYRKKHVKGEFLSVVIDGLELRYVGSQISDDPESMIFGDEKNNSYRVSKVLFTRDYDQLISNKINMLRYGDFESSSAGSSLFNGAIYGFQLSGINQDVTVAEVSSERSYAGSRSLKFVGTTGCYIGVESTEKVKATAFQEFVYGFKLAFNSTTQVNLATRIDAYDVNGVKISSTDSYQPSKVANTTYTWGYTSHIKRFIAPAGTDYIKIYFQISNFSGTVYVDDVMLNRIN
ncbi:hypothetical protein [Terribacillus saccharophilus]|uniref:hypothetical protein n=1 Tax=Terribacillus saccharophilus TaxID=361277 RepID=UPI003D2AD0C5